MHSIVSRCVRAFVLLFALAVFAGSAPDACASPMDNAWERLESAFKKLKESLKTPDETHKATYLKQAEVIKIESLKIREMEPHMARTLPKKEQPAFVAEFKTEMDEFIAHADTVIASLKASDCVTASTELAAMGKSKIPAHKKFRVKDYKKS
jgi:cytochrome c556